MSFDRLRAAEPRFTFEFAVSEGPSRPLVEAVAATTDTDPRDVEQLYDAVDPDALDEFFRHSRSTSNRTRVEFEYAGYLVTLETPGRGYLYDVDRSRDTGPAT